MGEDKNIKENIDINDFVVLDRGKMNSSVVMVLELTPQKMFARVINNEGLEWAVMTKRLTKTIG